MIAAAIRARLRLIAEDAGIYAGAVLGGALSILGGWAAHRFVGDFAETLAFVGVLGIWVLLACLVRA